jgi:transposase
VQLVVRIHHRGPPILAGSLRFTKIVSLGLGATYGGGFAAMELTTILNRCHYFRGFVYERARFSSDKKSIEAVLRPQKGSAAVCSRCHLPAPGYDQLAERRFEFIPLWGFFVFLPYALRRVDCRRCGVVAVEEVPWGDGKRTLTKAYMFFLARWARRLGIGAPHARSDRRHWRR